jgi:hypothetical protein
MRILVIAAALLAGCSTTRAMPPGPERIVRFEQEIRKIDEGENRCVSEAVKSSDRQIASIGASSSASADQQTQKLAAQRDRRLLECRADADREREELTARERADYQDRAQEERYRSSLTMILTTSRLH